MKRFVFLFFSVVVIFWSCEEKIKKVTIPAEKTPPVQQPPVSSEPTQKKWTVEEIAEIASNGNLETAFSKDVIEREDARINEGMDKVKVIWLNRGGNREVRIDFRPQDSIKVYRVTVEGKENQLSSKTGVELGMSLEALNAINRKPVDFYGFDWDFGGGVVFNNGALDGHNLHVYLKTDKEYGKRFMGDTQHSFEEAKQANLNLYVNKIVLMPEYKTQL